MNKKHFLNRMIYAMNEFPVLQNVNKVGIILRYYYNFRFEYFDNLVYLYFLRKQLIFQTNSVYKV